MGIDLTAPFIHRIETTSASWPICDRCSKKLGRPYRVEMMGLVGRERARQRRDKMRIIVETECHGEHHEFVLDHPLWWSEANLHDALGQTVCFVPMGGGIYGTTIRKDAERGGV